MLKLCLASGIALLLIFNVTGGVAAADPVSLPPVSSSKINSDDGYRVGVLLANMTIDAVPNMAATAFSREGFVTVTASLVIDSGKETSTDVALGKLELWANLGCQFNPSEGMNLGDNPSLGGGLSGRLDSNGGASVAALPGGGIDPNFNAKLKPGQITEDKDFSLGIVGIPADQSKVTPDETAELKSLKEGHQLVRVLQIQDFHIKIDNCGGPAYVRLHARASLKAFRSDDDTDVYSAIVPL